MKKTFPISFGGNTAPSNDGCFHCGKMPDGLWTYLSIGTVTSDNSSVDPSSEQARFSLSWDASKGGDSIGDGFEVIEDTSYGQANMTFCSAKCLRAFLNECVDHLEETMSEMHN